MSARKADYPSRSPAMRPKKPGKGTGKPSSHSGGRKSKTWLSAGTKMENNNRDVSPKLQFPWWKSPMFVLKRRQRWGQIA